VPHRELNVQRAVLDAALARQCVIAVEDHRVEHAREVAHHVLRDLRPERRAVSNDAPAAERAASMSAAIARLS
jgi:hypothetical protein